MPLVQIQIVRRYAGGTEGVVYAEDADFRSPREYEDAIRTLDRLTDDTEYTRTVGEDSPLRVSTSQEVDDADA